MRFFLLFLFVTTLALLAPSSARAEGTKSIELRANVVDYYSNRFILTADGNVFARLSDGTIVRGNTFSMDLKLNRFLIAGNVHVDGPHVHITGAAFAGYPDLDRTYFLSEGATPDRWTYFGQNFSDTHAGRQQPGDAFYFPDLSQAGNPYIVAKSATIFLKNNVEFPIGAKLLVLGIYTVTPGFVINYSSNPNFYQNGFAGATFDIGIPFKAAADAISAAHIRYDQYRGLYTAFDQHFVHKQDYAVLSVDPVTQNQRQYNAIFYKKISPAMEARFFFQLSALSQGLNQPTYASSYSNFVYNTKIGRYAVGINSDQYNDSLLPNAANMFAANGERQAGHPFDVSLNVASYEDEIRFFRYVHVPIKFQYRGGYGYNHDGYGIPVLGDGSADYDTAVWGGVPYQTIYQTYLGFTLYTASLRVANQTTLSAKVDRLEQWYTLPHHTVTTDFTATLARTPLSIKKPAYLLSYEVLNIGDFYGADQLHAYAPYTNTVTTQYGTYSGLAAFDGFATSRILSGSMIYTPTPYFALNVLMQKFDNTPAPVPGLGGQPPYQFTIDVRIRLSRQILLDVSRAYYFNFGGQLWSPQFAVQFSP
jgi:hypothetical protein